MSLPHIEQTYSETNLRGFLLKALRPNPHNNPDLKAANDYLTNNVDNFWNDVVVPLREMDSFDPNKINWYFEIYKEALEIRRSNEKKCPFGQTTKAEILEIKSFFNDLQFQDYLHLGTTFISNVYTIITSWIRDETSTMRLETIYSSEKPVDWIITAEKEERGLMVQTPDDVKELMPIIEKIGLIISMKL